MSRQFFQKVYLKENPPVDVRVPGPGHYTPKREYTETSPSKYSLRPKTAKDHSFQNHTKFVPGPGAYSGNTASENKNGFIANARYKSGGSIAIGRFQGRFNTPSMRPSNQVPGPGNYTLKLEMNGKGNYSLAQFKNSGAPLFGRSQRDTNLDTSVTRKSKHHNRKLILIYSYTWTGHL